jgi:hypothetical protein
VQLRRAFGSWPTDDFQLLSVEQRMAFYAGSEGLTGPDVLRKARELLTASESHGEYYMDGGEFLPLSVWGRRGFDESRIELHSLPADMRMDRVLGQTYRVKVLSTGNKGDNTVTRTSQSKRKSSALPLALPQDPSASSSSSRPRLALEDAAEPPADTPTPHASADEGSSSSSSDSSSKTSSSSSSSSGKKVKKGKKGKKDKKDKKGKKGKKDKKGKKGKKDKKGKKNKKDEHRGT